MGGPPVKVAPTSYPPATRTSPFRSSATLKNARALCIDGPGLTPAAADVDVTSIRIARNARRRRTFISVSPSRPRSLGRTEEYADPTESPKTSRGTELLLVGAHAHGLELRWLGAVASNRAHARQTLWGNGEV